MTPQNRGVSLTTRQPAEYSWMPGNPTPLMKIGQSLLCTGSSTQGTKPVPTINNVKSRYLEKREISTVSEFNEIRRGSYISRDDSNSEVRFVIRDLEKFWILTKITILPFFHKIGFS